MRKGQVSIEVILVLIFVILFLSIFSSLVKDTSKLLENSIVLDQEKEIAIALNSFLKTQEILVEDGYNLDFNNFFYIPRVKVPSKNIYCDIYITSNYISINTYLEEIITFNKDVNFNFSKINFSETIKKSCGDILNCYLSNNQIKCE
jgi:uncharacterized protein (UPF0333 family)